MEALPRQPMANIFIFITAGFALISLWILWCLKPKPAFKTPETKAFNPGIFKNFYAKPNLFVNSSEQALFFILYECLTPKYHVFSKVRLEDIIAVRASVKNAEVKWALRGRVKSRHVDFLITTPQGQPLMMIELDGASHHTALAQRPDSFKNGLAKSVGLPLHRIAVGQDFHSFTRKIMSELH